MEKRFHALCHIHNVLVKHARKCLKRLSFDPEYQSLKNTYSGLLKKRKLSAGERSCKKQLSKKMTDCIRSHGLSEYAFQAYLKVCAKQFRKCLSSQQVQKEATRVWNGVRAVLYGNGKALHFKKYRDLHTICGKTNTNGVKFQKDTCSIEWLGLDIPCRLPRDSAYIHEALDAEISYCEIERKMFPNGWHYYVVVYLRGDAPRRLKTYGTDGGVTGVDIGTSTIAAVSDRNATLKELAPGCKKYNRQIEKLLRRMDASKRISNPGKYKPDGTVDRADHSRWVYSKTYKKNRDRLRSLYRMKSAYIKQSHEELVNELLRDSVHYIVEDMSFQGLQRKAEESGRRDEISSTGQKDWADKPVPGCRRKKRFGRSLNNRAPACLITILERKAALYGGGVSKVKTSKFRASQYDHVADRYVKSDLSRREKYIGGQKVQRDLYSAFLLKNSNDRLDSPDREKCIDGFEQFLKLQNDRIAEMKRDHISMKQCFGF